MPLSYYINSLSNNMTEQPMDYYKNLQQAFYDSVWENTSALTTVQMQESIGSDVYNEVQVWINKAIGNTTTFMKNGEDYRQLLFKDINQECGRGYMFIFENSYWLGDFWNPSQGLAADILVRRCNNSLNIIDPENGSVFSIPCVIDYDLTAPTPLINTYILTPNSHAIVYVQANKDTLRLFTLNKRFMLNGRPFKLYAYQNTLNQSLVLEQPPVLYLDLYLDELHAKDDIENNVADNGEYNYAISIDAQTMNLITGSTGTLNATVALNGEEVNKQIVWTSSNDTIVTVDAAGSYQVLGKTGATATITATLVGNSNVSADVAFNVVDQNDIVPVITLNPAFDKIRQYQSITTEIQVEYNGQMYTPDEVNISLSESNVYLSYQIQGNQLTLTCNEIATTPQTINIFVSNQTPGFTAQSDFVIKCVSMLG